MKKPFLFTPGPTPLPERILRALSEPLIHHRSDDFQQLLRGLQVPLKKLFGTKNEVIFLTSSGSGGMEATVRSLLSKKDRVLIVNAGKFGARFEKIAESYGLPFDTIKLTWGQAVTLQDVQKKLTNDHRALLIQHSETSTGVLHPVPEIAEWVREKFPNCLVIVDAITSVGALPFELDRWGVDAAITGSQKALMLPPGLALVALSDRAIDRLGKSDLPGFYLDLQKERMALVKGQTAFTPSISLIRALKESLAMLEEEGFSNVFERHRKLAEATRAALPALKLRPATDSPSVACTAAYFPDGVDGKKLLKKIKQDHSFHIAGAQDEWEGKVLRISHLGYYTPFDLISALTALGCELKREGVNVQLGEAIENFVRTYGL